MTIYLTDAKTGKKILVNAASNWECAEPVQMQYDSPPIIGETPRPPVLTRITFGSGKILMAQETPEEFKALIDNTK